MDISKTSERRTDHTVSFRKNAFQSLSRAPFLRKNSPENRLISSSNLKIFQIFLFPDLIL